MKKPKTYWDTFTTQYQMGPSKVRLAILDIMEQLGGIAFLDVGCGTGPMYELNKNLGYNFAYRGVDYSEAMIEIARENLDSNVFFVEDARDLDEHDATWDIVLMLHSLDHLDDYEAAIAEAARVAGRYVIIVLWRGLVDKGVNLTSENRMGKEEGELSWEDTHLQEYSHEVLVNAFKNNALKIMMEINDSTINNKGESNHMFVLIKKEYEDFLKGTDD